MTVQDLEQAWINCHSRTSDIPALTLPPQSYLDVIRRLADGEKVTLPISGLEFYLADNGDLFLRWPIKEEK